MDDFPLDRPELTGSLITLEFGNAGRVHQMWVADPSLPEEGQEYQFVLPPVSFGEEFAEDYFPGTILLGARTKPDDPWILDRNKNATAIEEEDESRLASFEYEFSLLPELRVTGKFYEVTQPFPQIVWDILVANQGRVSIEIGELAFPMAFNNLFEGDLTADDRKPNLLSDRVRIHPFIGGAASYLFAQRMNGEPPGLLVYPGEGTNWELWTSVPATLSTPFRWGGIPVIYVFSRAATEREGWGDGAASASLVLEPGDSRIIQTRFAATGGDGHDGALQTLAVCGRPAMKLLPAAVAPRDVGLAIETGGATPVRYQTSHKAELETDSDEQGGFCFVRPKQSGPLRLVFEDSAGRNSQAQLYFTEPIENLIKARAKYILDYQFKEAPGTATHRAVLPLNLRTGNLIEGTDALGGPFAVESGLADALFLAEKNSIFPNAAEIEGLERMIREYVRDDLQNPSSGAVGCAFVDPHSVAIHYGRPQTYVLLANLYHAMSKVAAFWGQCSVGGSDYLKLAAATLRAMFRFASSADGRLCSVGVSCVDSLIRDLVSADLRPEAEELEGMRLAHAEAVVRALAKPDVSWAWHPASYEEAYWAFRTIGDRERAEKVLQNAMTLRGLGPCWWSYGSDIRVPYEPESPNHPAFADRGMVLLGHTTAVNSMLFFHLCDTDYDRIAEGPLRGAFGGMLGPWALVRPDGAASLGFCPDPASKQYGANLWTGDIGLSLFAYLRGAASWVLPSRTLGLFTFGCHFEADERRYLVRPWDGVGKRIVMRQIDFEASAQGCRILSAQLDVRKRWATFEVENPSALPSQARINVKGLWGQTLEVEGKSVQAVNGEASVAISLEAGSRENLEVRTVIN